MYSKIATTENLNRLIERFNAGPIEGLCENDHILIYNYMIELRNYREQTQNVAPKINTIVINKGVVTDLNNDSNTENEESDYVENDWHNSDTIDDIDLEEVPNLLYLDPATFENVSPNKKQFKHKFFRRYNIKKSKCV